MKSKAKLKQELFAIGVMFMICISIILWVFHRFEVA